MFKRILVPLDGSARAEWAIPVAARIARLSSGSIVFVRIVLPPVAFGAYTADHLVTLKPGAFERHLAEATDYLADIATTYASDLVGIDVETEVVSGATSPAIFSVARWGQVDLVIMCSHGETGLKRWMFGSVAQEAVRHSPVPVLVLNESGEVPGPSEVTHPLRVLVALDGSSLAETVLEPAAYLALLIAARAPVELHLLRVIDIPLAGGKFRVPTEFDALIRKEALQEAEAYLKEVTDRLQESLVDVRVTIISSVVIGADIAGTIIQQAERSEAAEHEGGYDLIALTTHGRSGLQRLMMGSVTERILGSTKLPLLVVRPHKVEAQVQLKVETQEDKHFGITEAEPVGLAT